MSNPQQASWVEAFDVWCSQLHQAGQLYGPAWEQLATAIKEHRADLLDAEGGPQATRQSRLPESIEEYLSVLRAITELMVNGPGHAEGIRLVPTRMGDRRVACRYPIQRGLEYRLLVHGEVIGTDRGRTINMSSSGILFESGVALPLQRVFQLSVDWPGRSSPTAKIELHVIGRTVRSVGNCTAVAIERHEFQIGHKAMRARQ